MVYHRMAASVLRPGTFIAVSLLAVGAACTGAPSPSPQGSNAATGGAAGDGGAATGGANLGGAATGGGDNLGGGGVGGADNLGGASAGGGAASGGNVGTGGQPPLCLDGLTWCDDKCVNLLADVDSCGACQSSCAPLAGAEVSCLDGGCAFTCEQDKDDCDLIAENGCEVDLLWDRHNCGACGEVCKGPCKKGSCADSFLVFISSQNYSGDLGGIAGADAKCQKLAEDAGLTGTFLAWLSDASTTPLTRFHHSEIPYVLVDGTKVADNWADLVDGTLDEPIYLTETGGEPTVGTTPCGGGGYVTAWSSTNSSGGLIGGGAYTCNSYGSTSGTGAAWGLAKDTTASWSSWCTTAGSLCGTLSALYCFEQP